MSPLEVMATTTMTFFIAINVLTLIANMLMFKKIGKNKWLGLIPVVSDYVLFDTFWRTKVFVVYLITYITFYICQVADFPFSTVIYIASSIVILVVSAMLMDRISRGFGKGVGCTIGLLMIYPVFAIYLACTGEYRPETKETKI